MKNFVVAINSFFDNDNKLFQVVAGNSVEAIKTALVLYNDGWIDDLKYIDDSLNEYGVISAIFNYDLSVGVHEIKLDE